MELLRQVQFLAYAFLLTLHVVIHAEASSSVPRASNQNGVNMTEWFSYMNRTTLYRLDRNSTSNVSSLIGQPVTCLMMHWDVTKNTTNGTVFLAYTNATNKTAIDILSVTPNQTEAGMSNDTIVFTFLVNQTELPEYENRTVEYQLLSTNYTSCSILKTSTGENCSYWVLYTVGNQTVPEWCQPTETGNCTVEVHTPDEPSECKDPDEDINYEELGEYDIEAATPIRL